MQPGLATLIFSHYGAHDLPFTADPALRAKARKLAARFQAVLGRHPDRLVFLGRIGQPRPGLPKVRSIRRDVADLGHPSPAEQIQPAMAAPALGG